MSKLLHLSVCSVSEEGGSYYLRAAEFSSLTDPRDVQRCATELIAQLRGAARALFGNFETVKVAGIERVEQDGKPPTQFILPDSIVLRGRGLLLATGASDGAEPAVLDSWAAIANTDAKVAEALRLFGSTERDYPNLYKVYEVVKGDVGRQNIIKNGWATGSELKRFTHTANCKVALGDEARHGVGGCSVRKHMPRSEAESLVGKILLGWVRDKGA